MADPRIYQVYLGQGADAGKGLAVARQFLAACGKPPDFISVWASLAPSTLARVDALFPREILSADVTLEPKALPDLVAALRGEPRVHNWFLVQRASALGSALGVGTRHPSLHDKTSAAVTLDFGDDPVPDAIAGGRPGRWLAELAAVGLLPVGASPASLMDRLATEFRARPATQYPPHRTSPPPAPPPGHVLEEGIQLSARGWRVMRGDHDWYWPGTCQLAIPVDPASALERLTPLFIAGGPVDFHGYYSLGILGRTGLAERLAAVGSATFVLHTSDSDETDVDEATVDALLALAGEDLVCVDWRCDWPGAVPGYNGVQLTVNGVGNLHDEDPEHVPGTTTVYFTVHPHQAAEVDALAARLVSLAGVTAVLLRDGRTPAAWRLPVHGTSRDCRQSCPARPMSPAGPGRHSCHGKQSHAAGRDGAGMAEGSR